MIPCPLNHNTGKLLAGFRPIAAADVHGIGSPIANALSAT